MTSMEQVNEKMDKMDALFDLAGTYMPVNTLVERDRLVRNTAHWLCFGRNRAQFQR